MFLCDNAVVPRVQGVVYFTRSLVEMENENVVNSAIEYVTTVQQTKMIVYLKSQLDCGTRLWLAVVFWYNRPRSLCTYRHN